MPQVTFPSGLRFNIEQKDVEGLVATGGVKTSGLAHLIQHKAAQMAGSTQVAAPIAAPVVSPTPAPVQPEPVARLAQVETITENVPELIAQVLPADTEIHSDLETPEISVEANPVDSEEPTVAVVAAEPVVLAQPIAAPVVSPTPAPAPVMEDPADSGLPTITEPDPLPVEPFEGSRLMQALVDLINTGKAFTDIHLELGQEMAWRRPSGWEPTGFGIIELEHLIPMLYALDLKWDSQLVDEGSFDRPLSIPNARLRCNVYRLQGGKSVAISVRKQAQAPIAFELLGLPKQASRMLNSKGLILVTGATGSGKTTTLASMLDYYNKNNAAHIITIEQPIEYVFGRGRAIISQKEVGVDTPSFSSGLHAALRQKPEVIMIGEVRDRETADTLMHAAESGHTVLATLHANSAEGSIAKLLSFFPADELPSRSAALANTLLGVISQALVPTVKGDKFRMVADILLNAGGEFCDKIQDPAKHKQIKDGLKQGAGGSKAMNSTLQELVKNGEITRESALRASPHPGELISLL